MGRLQQQYQQILASGNRSMTFEQFAYWDLMTAAGTNVQGAVDAQRRQFDGLQAANRRCRPAMPATTPAGPTTADANRPRWLTTATRPSRVALYVDSRTGHADAAAQSPAGPAATATTTPAQDNQGVYHRWDGNGWTRMDAAR
jgi:hypothetical protein